MPQQALYHGLQAREVFLSPMSGLSSLTAPIDGRVSLIWTYVVIGGARLGLNKQAEAEKAYKKANKEVLKFEKLPQIKKIPEDLQISILLGLGR